MGRRTIRAHAAGQPVEMERYRPARDCPGCLDPAVSPRRRARPPLDAQDGRYQSREREKRARRVGKHQAPSDRPSAGIGFGPRGVTVALSRLATFVIGLTFLLGVGTAYPAQVRTYDTLTLDFRLNHLAVIGDSYTTGTDEGGLGPKSWTARAWQMLAAARGERISA